MYKFYIVPDATQCSSHSELYTNMHLFYDPYAESDIYAVVNPKTKDELNKAGSLEFTVLPSNIHYNDFHKKKSVVIVFDEDTWLYEGVVIDAPTDFFKQRKVTCSGPLAYLSDSVQAPDERNVIEIPTSSSGTTYMAVPDTWLAGANPYALQWYVQQVQNDGSIRYIRTNNTAPVSGVRYFYPVASDGANYSGATTVRSAGANETIRNHISRLLEVHNSQVDPYKRIFLGQLYNSSDGEVHEFKASNFRDTWDALKSDILDSFGRYFTITRGNDNNLYLNYLDLAQLPSQAVPDIEFTNNLIEINESNNQDSGIFTVLVPIGKDNITVEGASGHNSPSNSNLEISPYIATFGGNRRYVVVSPKAVQRYGYIMKPQQFGDVDDANQLYSQAVTYINNNYDYHPEYEVKAIDIRFITGSGHRISVGDKCHISSNWHGINTSELYVISAEHDLANPENDHYRFGIPTSDRESKNRTLTSQTKEAQSKAARNSASTSSGMSRLHSILEDYIHVTEWGLEMSTNLKNQVESNDGKYMTRFIQDEQHINLAAQKLFGIDNENGHGDKDAGYAAVPRNEYRDSKGALKNPKTQVWFEKVGNDYVLSNDIVADETKTYYYQRLWTRYSNIDVGPGGIKATVDGNHERSTYCSSWISSNETQILAITGHIHVDADGNVIIDAGTGARTGYTSERTEVHYVAVQKILYGNSPIQKGWYERVIDSSGKWPGADKDESYIMQGATPGAYGVREREFYKPSSDAVANRDKAYYIRQTAVEEFTAEYGLYDENTLHGGVVARMVNNPQYFPVPDNEVYNAGINGETAYEHGWYIYIKSTGEFQQPLPGEKVNPHARNTYYKVKNTAGYTTDIWGEHIVIGRTVNYQGMNPANRAKVDKYLAEHRIDGTITEIASDIVVVDTLLAKYIEADEIKANTSLWAADMWTYHLHANEDVTCQGDVYVNVGGQMTPNGVGVSQAVKLFGPPTYDGDNVTIPYYCLTSIMYGPGGLTTPDGNITFTKPASLGRAVWSSGGGLDVYTTGGWAVTPKWTFYHANIDIPTNYKGSDSLSEPIVTYNRNGSNFNAGILFNNTPTLKVHMEIRGEDRDKNGNSVAFSHDSSEDSPIMNWSKHIYVDATLAHDDGWDHARLQMDWPSVMQALGERTSLTIKYPTDQVGVQGSTTFTLADDDPKGNSGYVRVYRDNTTLIGAIQVGDWYTAGHDDGWDDACLQMDWPSTMQSIGERTSMTIRYPGSGGGQESTVLTLLDEDTKGNSGYVRVYRDYIDNDHRGALIGAIQVGDWYSDGHSDGYSKGEADGLSDGREAGEKSGWNSCRAKFLENGDVWTVKRQTITASDVGKTFYVRNNQVDPGGK